MTAASKTTTPELLAAAASGAPSGVVPASPPDVESAPRPPSGGESSTPIWDELADRWAALQPLLARTIDEEADRG